MPTKINIGPIHPSTHGVLRLVVTLEGDEILNVEPHIGFLHRGVEKLCENRMYLQSPTYFEKLDYIAPMSNDEVYIAAVEAALGVEVKERAQYIRVVLLEFQRIASHLLWLGTALNDLGLLFTMFMWTFKDRDMILELLQEATGSRMFYVNMRLGGMVRDLPPNFNEAAEKVLEHLEVRLKEYESFLEKNPVFMERMTGVGVLSKKDAVALGVTGPVLRASGIEYDVRKNKPYYVYDKLHFTLHVQTRGDNFARYKVRMLEMKESIKLVRDALRNMPEGDAIGSQVRLIIPEPKNKEVNVSRELPRGEEMIYMIADKQRPYRLSIRSPSFINLSVINYLCKGRRFADLFSTFGSLDVVLADVDR